MVVAVVVFFIAGFYAMFSLMAYRASKGSAVSDRLAEVRHRRLGEPAQSGLDNLVVGEPDGPLGPAGGQGGGLPALRAAMTLAGSRLIRKGSDRRIESRLRRAGIRLRAAEYLAVRVGIGFVAGLAVFIFTGAAPLFMVGAAPGFLLPEFYVQRKIRVRLQKATHQLPDALAIIANSLRSGHSFLQAVDVAAEELADPLAAEFRQLMQETRVDIRLEDALANLVNRLPAPDIQLVVTAVLIQKQVGGNLAAILEQVADTIRVRMRIGREVKALSAQGRLSGWVLGLLPVALTAFVGLTNKSYMSLLFSEPLGRAMLGGAVVMELIGVVIISRMVQVDA